MLNKIPSVDTQNMAMVVVMVLRSVLGLGAIFNMMIAMLTRHQKSGTLSSG